MFTLYLVLLDEMVSDLKQANESAEDARAHLEECWLYCRDAVINIAKAGMLLKEVNNG